LKENGNLPAEFNVNLITAFKVEVKVSQSYTNETGGKTGGKVDGDVTLIEMTDIQKSIIDLIGADASISIDQMAVKMAVKKRTLEREIANMKQKGYISRTGSPRSGKWEVIIPYNCVIEIV
jgi:predicted HTH transcriptional regulator